MGNSKPVKAFGSPAEKPGSQLSQPPRTIRPKVSIPAWVFFPTIGLSVPVKEAVDRFSAKHNDITFPRRFDPWWQPLFTPLLTEFN
jgi:hypothetical protein